MFDRLRAFALRLAAGGREPIPAEDYFTTAGLAFDWSSLPERDGLSVSAAFAAIEGLTGAAIQLPVALFSRALDGSRERVTNHPAARLLRRPNDQGMTTSAWVQAWLGQALLHGTGYCEIALHPRTAAPIGLYPLNTRLVRVDSVAGEVVYRYPGRASQQTTFLTSPRWTGAKEVTLSEAEVLRLPLMTLNGRYGQNRLSLAARDLAIALAAGRTAETYYSNGSFPAGVVKRPAGAPKLSAAGRDSLRAALEEFRGPSQAARFMVLDDGTELEPYQDGPERNQQLLTRQHQLGEVARWFGVPPTMLQNWDRATYANAETADRALYRHRLGPILKIAAEELDAKLLTSDVEREKYFFRWIFQGIAQTDPREQSAILRELVMAGIITPNQAAAFLDLPPAGPDGDRYYRPTNLTVVGHPLEFGKAAAAARAEAAPRTGASQRGAETLLNPIATDVCRRTLRRARHRLVGARDPADVAARLSESQRPYLEEALKPITSALGSMGREFEPALLGAWIEKWSFRVASEDDELSQAEEAAWELWATLRPAKETA